MGIAGRECCLNLELSYKIVDCTHNKFNLPGHLMHSVSMGTHGGRMLCECNLNAPTEWTGIFSACNSIPDGENIQL